MKMFITLLLLASSLLSYSFTTRYDVNVGVLGKVGFGDILFFQEGDNYEIHSIATLTGMAATLTGDRFETYISTGKIVNDRYLPDTFIKVKKTNRKERIQTYTFDHQNKTVTLVEEKRFWESETNFDPVAFKLISKEVEKTTTKKRVLKDFTDQDVLSSYFTALHACTAMQQRYQLIAVGAHNDDQDVSITFLKGKKLQEMKDKFSVKEGNIYHLHVEPFDKEEDKTVDVIVILDKDGFMKKAILANVFWVGEVTATRSKHEVKIN